MVEPVSSNLPYLNSFLLFFVAGWYIRTIVVPRRVARRVGREFRYGHISPEERLTLTNDERRLLLAQKALALTGLLVFVLCAVFFFKWAGQPPR